MQTHPFEPIVFKSSKALILGTFPSLKSFDNSFYYSHPKNQFWKILSEISGYPAVNRDQKIWLLKELNLSVWDIIKSCTRKNSSDSNLKDIETNNIPNLLENYPHIETIAFTSRLAEKLYNQEFPNLEVNRCYLPSPSPAYAAMSFKDKCTIYKEFISNI